MRRTCKATRLTALRRAAALMQGKADAGEEMISAARRGEGSANTRFKKHNLIKENFNRMSSVSQSVSVREGWSIFSREYDTPEFTERVVCAANGRSVVTGRCSSEAGYLARSTPAPPVTHSHVTPRLPTASRTTYSITHSSEESAPDHRDQPANQSHGREDGRLQRNVDAPRPRARSVAARAAVGALLVERSRALIVHGEVDPHLAQLPLLL